MPSEKPCPFVKKDKRNDVVIIITICQSLCTKYKCFIQ